MLSCIPAKLIDLSAQPTTYVVEVSDAFKTSDFVRREFMRSISDVFKVTDAHSRTFTASRNVYDSFKTSDWVSRGVVDNVYDSFKAGDYIHKNPSKALRDSTKFTDWFVKAIEKVFEIQFSAIGWKSNDVLRHFWDVPFRTADRVTKHPMKPFRETVKLTDAYNKDVVKQVYDRFKTPDSVTKHPIKSISDSFKTEEIVLKASYTLTGRGVRRVYFLPKVYEVHWDIVEDTDHNVKVDCCRSILELFKRVRDKLA
jgi:hypothetical protein